jgi:hypothetical protein
MTDLPGRRPGLTPGRAIGAGIAGLLIGAMLWYFGVDLGFACAIAVLAVAIGLAWAAYSGPSAVRWPMERPAPRPGARSDVGRLAWAFRMHRGSVREPAFKAVRELAAVRLARSGLDLSSPDDRAAIVALLGEAAYQAVVPVHGILPSVARLQLCLDILDRLPISQGATRSAVRLAQQAPIPSDRSTADTRGSRWT